MKKWNTDCVKCGKPQEVMPFVFKIILESHQPKVWCGECWIKRDGLYKKHSKSK